MSLWSLYLHLNVLSIPMSSISLYLFTSSASSSAGIASTATDCALGVPNMQTNACLIVFLLMLPLSESIEVGGVDLHSSF